MFGTDQNKVLIVAELSANHLQNFDLALKTVEAMAKSGADAVKVQTYTPDTITIKCNSSDFLIKHDTIWDGKTLYDLYQKAYLPWEWHYKLKSLAEDFGLLFFSTPFDKTAVDFLESLDVPFYKIASFEITDIPLIEYVASKGKPVIISTGIATLSDIESAILACHRMKNYQIALLKCVSSYPTSLNEVNLRSIPYLEKIFNVVVGLSDHTLSFSVSVAAVTLGAKIIEKHFILDRSLGGPDAAFSLEPDEFKRMVLAIREIEEALGESSYKLSEKQVKARVFSRSLYVVQDVSAGDIISESNVRSIRPGYGLHPKYLKDIIGKKFRKSLSKGTPLRWEYIEL